MSIVALRVAWALTLSLLISFLAHSATAAEVHCARENVTIYSETPRDARLACVGAFDAIRFFKQYGVKTRSVIELHIQGDFEDKVTGQSAAGYYDFRSRRAYVLPFSDLKERVTPFDIAVDDVLYRSIVTHEIAHAIVAESFSVSNPSLKAREYLAYVATFSMMPADYRRRIFEKKTAPAFENEMDINSIMYLFNPIFFGQRAYKHFRQLSKPSAFIRQTLAGQTLANDNLLY